MKIIKIKGKTAIVDACGVQNAINIQFLKNLKEGDYVLVHAGFAIEKYDAKRAKEIIELFNELEKN